MIICFQAVDNETDRVSDRREIDAFRDICFKDPLSRSQQRIAHREYLSLYTLFARMRNYRRIV